jgi:alkylation response protein AidB-like acyl-CoA dehydrogenase
LELIRKLAQQGFLGAGLPEENGGSGLDMVTVGMLHEEIGRGCSSVRSLLTVHGMAALAVLKWGTPEQKRSLLPRMSSGDLIAAFALTEPQAGSDIRGIAARADEASDHFVLNGRKSYITFGQIADLFLFFAMAEGKPVCLLVPAGSPGLSITPMNGMLGTKASMLAELHLQNCPVPKENMIGRTGFGLSHVAASCLDFGRYSVACGCVGLAQACLDASTRYARERKQFGAPLNEYQLIRRMMTEMIANVEAARLLCYRAGYSKDRGKLESIAETWVAKYFASTTASKAADNALQIHGAYGFTPQSPVQRYVRDAKVMEIIEGSTQMHEIWIPSMFEGYGGGGSGWTHREA